MNLNPIALCLALAVSAHCRHRGLYYEGTDDPGCWERETMARRYNSEVGTMADLVCREALGSTAFRILRFYNS